MWIVPILLLVLYGLYLSGWLPVSMKRAAVFVGSLGSGTSHSQASFTACTGRVYRIIRFPETRSYSFSFSGRIQSGSVTATVQDRNRVPILTLSAASPDGIAALEKGKRYYLTIEFQNASGDYQLDWI